MFKKIISQLLFVILIVSTIGSIELAAPKKAEASFNYNVLCADDAFVNWAALDASGIQRFLVSKGSLLKDFTENGKTAAQIINYAARGNQINPIAILAMIQKEEGLITGYYSQNYSQTRLDWAMGYGYTDSIIYNQYKGFTNQVSYGTWQLRRNYDYWATNGSAWNVGNWMTIDGMSVRFDTKCTSALYRYTPHLGTNFTYYFNLWGGNLTYNAKLVAQGPYSGPGAYGVKLLPGQTFTIWVNYLNNGSATWYRTGAPTAVHLGAAMPYDRQSPFLSAGAWGNLVQPAVGPGAIGTFQLTMRAPSSPGVYHERFQPIVQNVKWIGPITEWRLEVTNNVQEWYKGQVISQGPWSGPGSYGTPLAKGQSVTLWVNIKNTGIKKWYKYGDNATHLGTAMPQDRNSVFFANQNRRWTLVQSSVLPGQIGTFRVTITAPNTAGTYYERFRPVTEGTAWFGPTMEWQLIVR